LFHILLTKGLTTRNGGKSEKILATWNYLFPENELPPGNRRKKLLRKMVKKLQVVKWSRGKTKEGY